MFGGFDIITVEPGTKIKHKGEELEVTEGNVVVKLNKLYMTQTTASNIKNHPSVETRKSHGHREPH